MTSGKGSSTEAISIYLVLKSDKIEKKKFIYFCHNTFSVLENIVTGMINHKN